MIQKLQLILIIFFTLFLAFLSFPNLPQPQTSAEIDDLFPKSSKLLSSFNQLERLFPKDLADALMFDVSKLSEAERDEFLYKIDEELSFVDGVVKVVQRTSVEASILPASYFLSSDKNHLRIFVHFDRNLSEIEQKSAHDEVDVILSSYPKLNPKRTGAFYLTHEVNRVIEEERNRQLPRCAAFLFFSLLIIFRSFRIALKIAISPVLSLVWLVACLNYFQVKLGSISQLSLPFILAVATSYSVHVATRLLVDNTKAAHRELVLSILFAVLTTIVGLLSMLFMQTNGVSEFALISSAGIILSAWFSLVLTPVFLKNTKQKLFKLPNIFNFKLGKSLASFIFTIICGLVFFIFRIEVHTEPLDFLPINSQAYKNTKELTEVFKGNHRLSLVFHKKDKTRLTRNSLKEVYKIQEVIDALPDVSFTLSAENLFLHQKIAESRNAYSVLDNNLGPADLVSEDARYARILIFHDLEGAHLIDLKNRVESIVQNDSRYNYEISGLELLIADHAKTIMHGIFSSIAFTLCLVVFLLFLVARSFRYIIVGLIPNIIPVISVLGVLGLVYKNMNLGAALVAVTTLSIAVDGTFHIFLAWFSSNNLLKKREKIVSPIRGVLVTTIVLSIGFSSMAFSHVLPIQQFSLLLTLSLIIGALADMILLPKILDYVYSRESH